MKTFALIIIVFLGVNCGFGQTRFGPLLGLNFASLSGKDVTIRYMFNGEVRTMKGPDMRTGFAVGGMMDLPVSENVSFAPEFVYSMKGGVYSDNINYNGVNIQTDLTMKLDYIDIPMPFKYSFPTEGSVRPALFAGPSLGFIASSKAKATASGGGQSSESESSIQNVSSTDFSFLLGGGIGVPVGGGTLQVGIRYSVGLSSVDNTPNASADVKNNYLGFTAGMLF